MKKVLIMVLVMTIVLAGVEYANVHTPETTTDVEQISEVITLSAWAHNNNMMHRQGMINFNKSANNKEKVNKEVWQA